MKILKISWRSIHTILRGIRRTNEPVSKSYYLKIFQYALWSNPKRYEFLYPKNEFKNPFLDQWMMSIHELETRPCSRKVSEAVKSLESNVKTLEIPDLYFMIESLGRLQNWDSKYLNQIKRNLESACENTGKSGQELALCHAWLQTWLRLHSDCDKNNFENSLNDFSQCPKKLCQSVLENPQNFKNFKFEEMFYTLFLSGLYRQTNIDWTETFLDRFSLNDLTHFEVALLAQILLRGSENKNRFKRLSHDHKKLEPLFYNSLITLPQNKESLIAVKSLTQVLDIFWKNQNYEWKLEKSENIMKRFQPVLNKVDISGKLRLLQLVKSNRTSAISQEFLDKFVSSIILEMDSIERLKDMRLLCYGLQTFKYDFSANSQFLIDVSKRMQKLRKTHFEDLREEIDLTVLLLRNGVLQKQFIEELFQKINDFDSLIEAQTECEVLEAATALIYRKSNPKNPSNNFIRTLLKITEIDFLIELHYPGESMTRLDFKIRKKLTQLKHRIQLVNDEKLITKTVKSFYDKLENELDREKVYLGPILPYARHDILVIKVNENGQVENLPKEFAKKSASISEVLRPPRRKSENSIFLCITSSENHVTELEILGYKVLVWSLKELQEYLQNPMITFSNDFFTDQVKVAK